MGDKKKITHNSNFVEIYKNAGEVDGKEHASVILEAEVPAGSTFILEDNTPIVAKLKDSNNNELEHSAEIIVGARDPDLVIPQQISRELEYHLFREMSIAEQVDSNRNSKLEVSIRSDLLNGREGISFSADQVITVTLVSDTQIDWDNSKFQLPVREG